MATRTDAEVAALRAAATDERQRVAGLSERSRAYVLERADAVEATVAWLVGERSAAPASGDENLVADVAGITRERSRAGDIEDRERRAGRDGVWPGVVAQTLSWYLGRAHAEAPLVA